MPQKEEETKTELSKFVNPIDKKLTAEAPGLLPYASNAGSAIIKPIDKGRAKGMAVSAMYEQTNVQLDQIRAQVELLAQQARAVHRRVELSEKIYLAEMGFKPRIGHTYFLYQRKDGRHITSMIGPDEWGRSKPYEYLATVKLLSDHTWEVSGEADIML